MPTHFNNNRATEASDASLVALEPGRMWASARETDALASAGLASFDAVMRTTDGKLLRALPDRENWRLELHAPHRGPRGAYLKKHHVRSWSQWLRARCGLALRNTPGRVEAENIARLEGAGIAAMRLIAFGERLGADGLLESFVLTEELRGYTQLDHFLRQRFTPMDRRDSRRRDRALVHLLEEVAVVARRFHRLGFNHRDLYCCHFFIREEAAGEFRVNLIDLQRVQHRRWLRGRWIVKDLAQLAYSLPPGLVTCGAKLKFMKTYLGVKKLRPEDKRLIRRVLFKKWLLERKHGATQ